MRTKLSLTMNLSITEVPFADPSMAEIHKAYESDSDPLAPRVTRSKSRSLNIEDLIKGTEVNASSSDSESDAEPCSDAPAGSIQQSIRNGRDPESNSRRLKSARL
jgi:hypothetical protein